MGSRSRLDVLQELVKALTTIILGPGCKVFSTLLSSRRSVRESREPREGEEEEEDEGEEEDEEEEKEGEEEGELRLDQSTTSLALLWRSVSVAYCV